MKTFGEYLREHRIKNGYSLRTLAQKMDCAFSYLGQAERNEVPALVEDKWDKLLEAMPTMTRREIEDCYLTSCQVKIDLYRLKAEDRETVISVLRSVGHPNYQENHMIS